MNRPLAIVCTVTLVLGLSDELAGQRSTRFQIAAGPYRVDRIARTPIVPSIGLFKPFGDRGLAGGNLGLIADAGFYGLTALSLDLHVGLRSRPARVEWNGTVGPSGMLGGDGDGTPYIRAGAHGTVGLVWWVDPRIGLTASTTGRIWFTTGNSRFSPSGAVGITFRRR